MTSTEYTVYGRYPDGNTTMTLTHENLEYAQSDARQLLEPQLDGTDPCMESYVWEAGQEDQPPIATYRR